MNKTHEEMIDEFVSQMPPSYTIRSHEENPYESTYVDIDDVRRVLSRFITTISTEHAREVEEAVKKERERIDTILNTVSKEVDNPTISYGTDIDITEMPIPMDAEMKGFIKGWKTGIKYALEALTPTKTDKQTEV